MKKSLFFAAAASALMLTACSSENDVVQNAPQTQETVAQAVGFDIYTPAATNVTRAGRAGVMTTNIMQQTGFGVYAYQIDDTDTDNEFTYTTYEGNKTTATPNFMWNQQVNYNKTATGWYYSPLKYWPNETYQDSQTYPSNPAGMPEQAATTKNVDKLTFFAYAPWVNATTTKGDATQINANIDAEDGVGITDITANTGILWTGGTPHNRTVSQGVGEPKINYVMATNPDYSVDLLWGVAPVGGLSYTNVSGSTTTVAEGMPLKDLVKPAVNTNIKFLFQHALARLGVKIVAAVDQVAAGGNFDYANTKITVEEIRIMGEFGTQGILNLNNTAPKTALWTVETANTANTDATALKINKDNGLAPHLVYDATLGTAPSQQTVTGVTTSVADAIKVRSLYDANYVTDCATEETNPVYSATRPYFNTAAKIVNSTTTPFLPDYYTYNNWSPVTGAQYFYKYTTNSGVTYTDITSTINTKYPTAYVWENIYVLGSASTNLHAVTSEEYTAGTYNAKTAYRKNGNTYTETGTTPQIGDYVFLVDPTKQDAPQVSGNYFKAKPNYFMVIPPTNPDNKTIKVKITYYVSTTDPNVAGGVVYTKNEVEKDVVLPDFVNGKAYDLKLILGLTSVKIEADVTDWTTTNAEVNLPQNTSE